MLTASRDDKYNTMVYRCTDCGRSFSVTFQLLTKMSPADRYRLIAGKLFPKQDKMDRALDVLFQRDVCTHEPWPDLGGEQWNNYSVI